MHAGHILIRCTQLWQVCLSSIVNRPRCIIFKGKSMPWFQSRRECSSQIRKKQTFLKFYISAKYCYFGWSIFEKNQRKMQAETKKSAMQLQLFCWRNKFFTRIEVVLLLAQNRVSLNHFLQVDWLSQLHLKATSHVTVSWLQKKS